MALRPFALCACLLLLALPLHSASICNSARELSPLQKELSFSYSHSCPLGILTVKITDSTKQPVSGIRVGLLDQTPPINDTIYEIADADGKVTFALPDGGDYFVFNVDYGKCPQDGRFLPTLDSCTSPKKAAYAPANNSSSPAAPPPSPPSGPPDALKLVQKPQPLPKPGSYLYQQSVSALDAIVTAQKLIGNAVSSLGNAPSPAIEGALFELRLAQQEYALENFNSSKSHADGAASLAKAAIAKNPSTKAQAPISNSQPQELPSLIFWIGLSIGVALVAFAIYKLLPKGALD